MRPVRNQPLVRCQLLEAARTRQSASARDDELTREETFAQDQKHAGPKRRGSRVLLRDEPTYGNTRQRGRGWPEDDAARMRT